MREVKVIVITKINQAVLVMKIQKRNRFYELKARGEQESSPDVVMCMLQVFSVNVYALLDPGDNFVLLHLLSL